MKKTLITKFARLKYFEEYGYCFYKPSVSLKDVHNFYWRLSRHIILRNFLIYFLINFNKAKISHQIESFIILISSNFC